MLNAINKKLSILALLVMVSGCQKGTESMQNRTNFLCGDKPNCVSTQDEREKFHIAPFTLAPNVTLAQITEVALQLPGAKLAVQDPNYAHIECTSKIMKFVDDLVLEKVGDHLIVRSESRVGYSDFGVNRKRTEQLRALLTKAKLLV